MSVRPPSDKKAADFSKSQRLKLKIVVELEGVEPSSKQGNHTLSTRLFQPSVFEHQQDLDHQLTP